MVCTEPVLHVFCSTHYKPELSFNRPTECDLFCSPVLNIHEIKCNRSTRHSLRLSISNRTHAFLFQLAQFGGITISFIPVSLQLRNLFRCCAQTIFFFFFFFSLWISVFQSVNVILDAAFFANVHFFDRFQPKSECVCVHAFLSCYNINDPVLSDDIRKTKTQPVCIEHCSARTHTHTHRSAVALVSFLIKL